MLENVAANMIGNLATNALPGNEDSETSQQLLADIHRILEKLLSVTIAGNQPHRDYVDIPINALPGIADFNFDARERGFSQIAFYSPVAVAAGIVLRRPGPFDLALALPAGKFATIQQPLNTLLVNTTANTIPLIVRYSDIVWGSVLP